MKYFVKIDRKSIKKNPNAGNKVYQRVLAPDTIEVSVIAKDINGGWANWFFVNNYLSSITPSVPPKDDVLSINVNRKSNIETLHTLQGGPKYFFGYEDTEVECEDCHKKFSHTLLKDDYVDIYDGEDVCDTCKVDNLCPHCKTGDCCSLEFEQIEKVENLPA